ncbi:ABC transporter family substrate-binding protein [Isoptericola hypogeus]|uniref:ABC transporter family substrate-binding protein n=1 Tax=Isoptericola hypogeus TaxID=300179 RepID=A0ABP4VN66_9MICO
MRTTRILVLAAALAVALTACSGGDGDSDVLSGEKVSTTADYNPQPREALADGGTLTTVLSGALYEQLNPMHADMNSGVVELARWNTPQLQSMSPEGEVTWDEDYVTEVTDELVDGNREVTFTINDEAAFNDGTPIDWRAFEARWEVSNGQDEAYSVYTTEGYADITSVEAGEDDKQAVVTYDGPGIFWKSQFDTVLHPDVADPETFNIAFVKDLHNEWGAGPYRVKDLSDSAVVYERNPEWWGDPGKLDERIFRFMEATAAINAFRNGEIDAVPASTKESLAQIESMDGIELRSATKTSSNMLQINPEAPLLKEVPTRQAIALGFDRETLAKVQFDGLNSDTAVSGSLTLYPFQDGYRDVYAAAGGGYDPDQAKILLDEAGWTVGEEGIREKDGERLELVWPITTDTATAKNVSLAAQQMMKRIGVDLVLDFRDSSELVATYDEREYDVLFGGWGTSAPDEGLVYFCSLFCSDNGGTSMENYEQLTPRAAEAVRLSDHDDVVDTFMDLEQQAFEQFDIVPLWNVPDIVAVKEGLANYGAGLFFRGRVQDIGWQES